MVHIIDIMAKMADLQLALHELIIDIQKNVREELGGDIADDDTETGGTVTETLPLRKTLPVVRRPHTDTIGGRVAVKKTMKEVVNKIRVKLVLPQ